MELKKQELMYYGDICSLNDIYSSPSWRKRSNLKKKYRAIFSELVKESDFEEVPNRYSLELYYRSRHDADNIVMMEKFFLDTIKKSKGNPEGIVQEDSPKYYKGLSIFFDEEMERNSIRIVLISHEDEYLTPEVKWKKKENKDGDKK